MHRYLLTLVLLFVCACDDDLPDIDTLCFESDIVDIIPRGVEAALIKEQAVIIGVYGLTGKATCADAEADPEIRRIEIPSSVAWTTEEPDLIRVTSFGASGHCLGAYDWFDTPLNVADGGMSDAGPDPEDGPVEIAEPFEPTSRVTARYKGVENTIDVAIVVNGTGTWQVFIDDSGEPYAELALQQSGRVIEDPLLHATGRIDGDTLTLKQGNITLTGTLVTRNRAEGRHPLGDWVAVRVIESAE